MENQTQETLPATLEMSTQIETLSAELKTKVAIFTSFGMRIDEFKQRAAITPDLSTVAGDKEARAIRQEEVAIRKELGESRLGIGRHLTGYNGGLIEIENAVYADLAAAIKPIDDAIKAKEAIAAAKKVEKQKAKEEAERIEKARVEGIRANIQSMRSVSIRAVSKTADEVKIMIDGANRPDETYQEFKPEADTAFDQAMTELNNIYTSKLEAEETARKQADEQARLAKEQAEIDAKRKADQEALEKRIADQKAIEEKAQAERDRIAAEEKKKRDAEQAVIDERNRKEAKEIADRKAELDKHEAKLKADAEGQKKREVEEQNRVAAETAKAEAEKKRLKIAADLDLKQLEAKQKTAEELEQAKNEAETDLIAYGTVEAMVRAIVNGEIRHIKFEIN